MIASYPLMFGFGLLLLAAWAGWGAALEWFFLRRPVADRALQAGWGMAWTCVVGGVLNLAGWISPRSTHLFLATGLALLASDVVARRHAIRSDLGRWWAGARCRRTLWLVGLLLALMMASVYAAALCSKTFNVHDDLQGYLVYPEKMIQTGTMGPDPYSERRILSLGAMSFLHAIILGVADSRYFGLIDPGISLVLVVALLLGLARDARAGPWVAALAVFLFVAVPPPRVNVTSLVSGLALFLTLFRTLSGVALRGRPSVGGAVLVALAVSGLCSLKTTFVVPCALTVVGAYLLKGLRSRSRGGVLGAVVFSSGLALLFMAPWMVSLYQSSGTLLFPLLGRGFHGSAYAGSWTLSEGLSVAAVAGALMSTLKDLRAMPVWVLGIGLLLQKRACLARGALPAFLVAALAGYTVLTAVHRGPAFRYSWAFLYASLFTLVIYSAGRATAGRRRRWPVLREAAVALAVAMFLAGHSEAARSYWERQPWSVGVAIEQSRAAGFRRGAAQRYARMQRAVPPGAVVLARLQFPFVLDFRRNSVFIADYPGGASPPPGMPFFQGGEPLADYLCARGVEYVAYSYRQQAGFGRERYGHRLGPDTLPWNRAQARHAFDFQDNLMELEGTRYRVYDDGDVFVLDLGATAEGMPLGCVVP